MSASLSPHKQHRASLFPRRPYTSCIRSPRHRCCPSPGRRRARNRLPPRTSPSFPSPAPPVHILHPQPPPPPLCLPQAPPRPPTPSHVHVFLPPRTPPSFWFPPPPVRILHPQPPSPLLQDLELGAPHPQRPPPTSPGGAGMQEGVHMVHIVEEIRTCTPANPNEGPWRPSCHMGHGRPSPGTRSRASATLTPPKPSAGGSEPLDQRHRPSAPRRPPPHPTTTTPGRERARAREGQGEGRDTPARGQGGAQGNGQAPTGTGHRGAAQRRGRGAPTGQDGEGTGATALRERAQRRAPGRTHRKSTQHPRDKHRPNPS